MFSILVTSTKKAYSSFLKSVCVFEKTSFTVKVQKTFKISSDHFYLDPRLLIFRLSVGPPPPPPLLLRPKDPPYYLELQSRLRKERSIIFFYPGMKYDFSMWFRSTCSEQIFFKIAYFSKIPFHCKWSHEILKMLLKYMAVKASLK